MVIEISPQNLRDEVAMDVDEDEHGTQRPRKAQDFGIEVDFDCLNDDEREVLASCDFLALKPNCLSSGWIRRSGFEVG
jgi:hypothetical protein